MPSPTLGDGFGNNDSRSQKSRGPMELSYFRAKQLIFLLFFWLEVLCVSYFLSIFNFCALVLSLSLAVSGWPQLTMQLKVAINSQYVLSHLVLGWWAKTTVPGSAYILDSTRTDLLQSGLITETVWGRSRWSAVQNSTRYRDVSMWVPTLKLWEK